MNDQPKAKTLSKQKLEVVNLEMDVPYSQGTKHLDRVHAVNHSLAEGDPLFGKTLRMTVFNNDLKNFIRGKEIIVADIEEKPRPDQPEYGPDRTIVQAYDDNGNAVSRKKGGGFYGQRRSMDDDLALAALNQFGQNIQGFFNGTWDLHLSPILDLDCDDFERLAGKYWKAVEKGLDRALAIRQDAPQKPQDQRQGADKPAAAVKDAAKKESNPGAANGDGPIKHVGDLLTRAKALGVSRDDVTVICEVNDPAGITDLETAWKRIQEHAASKKESAEEAWDNMKRSE